MQTVTLTQITPPELETLIEKAIHKFLAERSQQTSFQPQDELMTVPQTADFLSLSVPTIYGLIHKAAIPHMKRGKRVYFSRTDLMAYVKAGRVKTQQDFASDADTYLQTKKGLNNGK